jgi:hypothetical protein
MEWSGMNGRSGAIEMDEWRGEIIVSMKHTKEKKRKGKRGGKKRDREN